ncbi:MAG TPA: hypothetical protein EYP65_04420 [Armatimonadetes bacterium]|nr:hypothetical protein [Armatimonadota bacterium]
MGRGKAPSGIGRVSFILITVGAVIGAGDILRFPYLLCRHGGAYLVPYLFFLLCGGLWLLGLEFSLGSEFGRPLPGALRALGLRGGGFWGWAVALNALVVVAYYCAVVGLFSALPLASMGEISGLGELLRSPLPFLATLSLWGVCFLVCLPDGARGLKGLSLVTLPLSVLLLLYLFSRGLLLRDGWQGLSALSPDWPTLLRPETWLEAGRHAVLSLVLGYGVMVALSSRLPKGEELMGSAVVVALSEGAVGLLAAHALLPFFAAGGVPPESSPLRGALLSFPEAVREAGGGALPLVALTVVLLFSGLTTLAALVEAISFTLADELGWRRGKAVGVICGLGPLLSVPFLLPKEARLLWFEGVAESMGVWNIDVVDHFCALFAGLFLILEARAVAHRLGRGRLARLLRSREIPLPWGLSRVMALVFAPLAAVVALLGLFRVDLLWLFRGTIYNGGVVQGGLWLALILVGAKALSRLGEGRGR